MLSQPPPEGLKIAVHEPQEEPNARTNTAIRYKKHIFVRAGGDFVAVPAGTTSQTTIFGHPKDQVDILTIISLC